MPITKNSTSKAYPMACKPPLIPTITSQIPPPLNSSGLVLMSCQISASLLFQVFRAEFRLSTIQFPLPNYLFTPHLPGTICPGRYFFSSILSLR